MLQLKYTPEVLTEMGYSVEQQVKLFSMIATCYDTPSEAPKSEWDRAMRHIGTPDLYTARLAWHSKADREF